MSSLKNFFRCYYFFFNFLHKNIIIRYIRCIEVNIRVSTCLLGCNFKFTSTLIFTSAVTGTDALATALEKTSKIVQCFLALQLSCCHSKPRSCTTTKIFLHSHLLMMPYSRTTNIFFYLIENYVTKPAKVFWGNR